MISNTTLFYKKAMQYQSKRADLMSEYEKGLQSLERYRGSEAYTEDLQKLKDKHEAAMTALIDEYRPAFQTILGGMTDTIGRRSIPAPTADQVNTLSILRMRKKLTADDVARAAQSLKGSRLALDVLSEIAAEHGLPHDFDDLCPEMSSSTAERVVENLRSQVEDFLQFDTPRSARVAARYYQEHYGTETKLPKRAEFADKAGCFAELGGMDPEALEQFSAIVDGGGADE